jgi:adenylosuccinate synthase
MLDLNYGTYPFVTSCNTIAAGAYTGGGAVPGTEIRILGISKAYTTRVGAGPFPTELKDAIGDELREAGHEYGTTTGRPRRVGYLDLYALRYAVRLSGIQELALTKIDTLASLDNLKLCIGYELDGKPIDFFPADSPSLEKVKPILKDVARIEELTPEQWWKMKQSTRKELPPGISQYLKDIESFVGIPVTILSYGPERNETIVY